MRSLAILGLLAALSGGCALDAGESGPTRDAEPTAEERAAFDASLFKFSVLVIDDGKGLGGGSQRASTVLQFVDARESWLNQNRWNCRVTIDMPIRHRLYGIITPERAAELSADVADVASSSVMNSQPQWIGGLFCKRFADKMTALFTTAPGGSFGARVTSP
jgi:hypothetical protein